MVKPVLVWKHAGYALKIVHSKNQKVFRAKASLPFNKEMGKNEQAKVLAREKDM